MSREPTIYQQLKAITQQTGWPDSFLTDLTTHDRAALLNTEAGDRLIWVLRSCGTTLTRCPKSIIRRGLKSGESYSEIQCGVKSRADLLKANHDEYILHRKEPAARFYRIDVGEHQRGTVAEITPAEALSLTRYG